MVLSARILRPLKRSCSTGSCLQSGYDELCDAISRVALVNSHGMSLSMITSLSKMLLMMIVLVGGTAAGVVLLWKEWQENLTQRSWFLFGGAIYFSSTMKFVWNELCTTFTQSRVLQISVDRRSSSTLFKRYADDLIE